ncbi:MAG: hypothetical protein WC974_09205, partial [Thermoplasmata archaeon]
GVQPSIQPSIQPFGADTQLFFGGSTYYIAGSGITSTGTSITLTSLTIPQTGQKILDADLSSTFFITVEPGNTTRQEFASCTTITQNSTGTATLSGCSRGLAPISPYTASTTLGFAHSGGSKVIFSNPPQFYDQATFKANDETITGTWLIGTPTASTQITNKTYVDNVANAGAATSTSSNGGIVEIGTQAEMASGTTADADKPRAIITDFSTSTPDGTSQAGKFAVISETDGKLNQLWLDLTENYTFSGTNTYSGVNSFTGATTTISSATTTITTTTGVLGFATSTPTLKSNGVSIGADVYIGSGGLGVGVATTTNDALQVSGLTYLNNLHITGTTTGGPMTYTASSTAFSVSTGAVTYTGSIPTNANSGFASYVAASGAAGGMQGDFTIFRVGKTSAVVGRDDDSTSGGAFVYTFSWSGANFVATETTDDTSSVTGTIYWYK